VSSLADLSLCSPTLLIVAYEALVLFSVSLFVGTDYQHFNYCKHHCLWYPSPPLWPILNSAKGEGMFLPVQ